MKRALQVPVFLCYVIATICLTGMVLMGLCLRWLYEKKGWPNQTDKGNCWSFAFPRWLDDPSKSYLVVRTTHHRAPIAHVQFAPSIEGLEVEEFVPLNPQRGWKAIINSFWFKGKIRKGLGEE